MTRNKSPLCLCNQCKARYACEHWISSTIIHIVTVLVGVACYFAGRLDLLP